jgi:DNA processing protein
MEDTATRRDWLALVRAPGLGAATLTASIERMGGCPATELLHLPSGRLRASGLSDTLIRALEAPDWEQVDRDLQWLEASPAHHLVPLTDPRFPTRLREIADPPLALLAVGDLDLLERPQLAIVGSRNPTPGGRRTAREFARHLAASGLGITSGLAEGIDAAAHEGALDGDGMTLAVMGTGPDRVYPASNRELARRIAASGLLVTEFLPGTGPHPGHFPRRNRIIAALSLGVVVVEAAEKSGSLITARLATEYGREVFAIPGSIHNPLARGCHRLIRQGAKLVETAADILEEIAPLLWSGALPQNDAVTPSASGTAPLDPEYQQLLDLLGFDPTGIDALVEASGLTAEAVSSMLLMLELQGHVTAFPGGRYSRVTPDLGSDIPGP